MKGYTAYKVDMTEHERGWGSKPDGSLLFDNEAAADYFLKEEYAGRDARNVPDYYISYSKSGWVPITKEQNDLIAVKGHIYSK